MANARDTCRSHPAFLTTVADKAIGFTSCLATQVVAWGRWTSAPLSQDTWSLYRSATVLVVVLTALRVSKGWCFSNGLYLRRRVLLLAQIRAFVQQWEAKCLGEVEACCADVDGEASRVLTSFLGADVAETMLLSWGASNKQRSSPTLPSPSPSCTDATNTPNFYGITASIAFSDELPLEEMLELAYVAPYVLHLDDDRAWLQRFVRLLQYVLLRRVSLMEEARLYAQLCRRVLFPSGQSGSNSPQTASTPQKKRAPFTRFTRVSPLCVWRLHRRPTWLVPLASPPPPTSPASSPALCASFFCLPLSYFPIESVLPYTAANSWLNDRLLDSLLPTWKKNCRQTLKDWAAPSPHSVSHETRENSPDAVAACKISYWFLHFTAPLLRRQVELHRSAARRFYTQKLYSLAFRDAKEECDSGCGTSPGIPHREGGSLRLLLRCATALFSLRCQDVSPEVNSFPVSQVNMGQVVRRALLLRAVTQGLSIALQVCFPRLSLRHLIEMATTGYYLHATASTASTTVSTNAPQSVSSTFSVDAFLRSLMTQMAWSIASSVAEVFLQRFVGSIGDQLSDLLSSDITATLEENLLHVDEAFFRRWLRGSLSAGHGSTLSPSPSPAPELRANSAGSFFVKRPLTAEDVLGVGRHSGEKVMAVHDAVVKLWLRCTVLGVRAVVTREWRPLLGAVATTWVDVTKLISAISVRVGYSLPQDVARLLSRRDESLPTRSPAGLRLLLEVLVEDAESMQETAAQHLAPKKHRAASFGWRRKEPNEATRFSTLPHPYLALVACASVWSFDHLLGVSRRDSAELYSLVRGIRKLYTTVAAYPYARAGKCPANANGAVASMRDDARCIAYYSLNQLEQQCSVQCAASTFTSRSDFPSSKPLHSLHPLLDEEETRLLQTPTALAYLPENVDYFDLFSLPYRFILRQLGLEMVFAYRTATGMQQDSRQTAEEWWTLTLFNSTFNPLTSVLREGFNLLAACATALLLCTRVHSNGQMCFIPVSFAHFVQATHTIDVYRDILRGGVALRRLEGNVCPAQQLCEWLPRAIWWERSVLQVSQGDGFAEERNATSIRHGSPSVLQERRRLWRRHVTRYRPELLFDQDDRIVGGLRLRYGVSWHHVYFCYPQLYRAAFTAAADQKSECCAVEFQQRMLTARPVLRDLTFRCPSAGMTAVIGPSGAGKSSLNLLLRRLYDPVPVIQQQQRHQDEKKSVGSEEVNFDLNNVGLRTDAEEALMELLHLALLENTVPPPPGMSTVPPQQSSRYGLSIQPGYLALDNIPMCIFSSVYIREWFAWLPQSPVVFPQYSFLRNVSVMSPTVTLEDVQRALQLCGCADFMVDKNYTVHDKVGPISGGEGQRLALARVVASVFARLRLEVIQCCDSGDDGDVLVGNSSAAVVGGIMLDEPTSRLDAANELRLLASLTALQNATTRREYSSPSFPAAAAPAATLPLFMWVISHRMSSLRSATFMVVVENGAVTATGSPHEVLQQNLFAKRQLLYQCL